MTHRPSTEELIRQLASSPAPAGLQPFPAAALLLGAVMAAVGAFLLLFGARPDLMAALSSPEVLAKMLLPPMLAIPALVLALRSARPGAPLRLWPLTIPVVAALALLLASVARTPSADVAAGIIGQTALACLASIGLLSAPAITLGLMLFRRGASVHPRLTGGLIGLAVSASVATGYALHCNEDSPLFFTTWYGLAILGCTALGAFAGGRMLRW